MDATPSPAAALNETCPRCGGPFHCGAGEAVCECFDLRLSPELMSELRENYQRCLCIACLKALQGGAPIAQSQLGPD
ncbi:cysteine-rich CWC family protein [Paucibacter sp. XJ19-41]|uniref:cysteine-rich CWC family protein n=1 Tax=Paucibacter sp. XJ19-41 TaxID=2927824 RepID=UPI00234AB794|nr:cysteine-rich CWC family protein [Paucibacter sp. XJ19-41]MDC6166503.1 cysteine-rich CWC family protein [Paucibacter sp. XJ19-41]